MWMNLIALIKSRARDYRCLSCSRALKDCDVELLTRSDGHCTVRVTCAACTVSFVAVILLKKSTHPDGVPAGIDAPITGDDLLDVHQRLKHHQGSLKDLLPVTPGPG
jgi:hypothetical protein